MKELRLLTLLMLLFSTATSQQFPLVSNFGSGGRTIVNLLAHYDANNQVAAQSSNKIILSTSVNNTNNNFDFCILRFKPDGIIDSSFGTNGIVLADLGGIEDYAYDMKVLKDDKILMVGTTGKYTNRDFVIAKFSPDGMFDENFGANGIIKLSKTATDFFYAVEIDQFNRILAAGYSDGKTYVYRFNPDGSKDYTFGINGITTLDFGGLNNSTKVKDLSILNNREIVVAGQIGGDNIQGFISKLDTSGNLLSSFGVNGIYKTPSDQSNYFCSCDSLNDSKIIVGGYQLNLSPSISANFKIYCFNNNGTLDTTFNHTGWATINFNRTANVCNKIIVQSSNSIFALGYSDNIPSTDANLSIVKLLENGSPDFSWGEQGKISYDFGSTNDIAHGAFIDLNDRLVVSGVFGGDNNALLCQFKTTIFDSNLKPISKVLKLNIYPNPCSKSALIEIPDKHADIRKLKLIGIDGKQYYPSVNYVTNSTFNIETCSLSKGIYVVKYIDNDIDATGKLIKD